MSLPFPFNWNPLDWWAKAIQGEDPTKPPTQFPKTQEERENFFVFSPFMSIEDATPEMLIAAFAAIKIAKQPKGLEILRDLGKEYLITVGKIVAALEHSSTTSWLNCWINQKLSLRVCRRMGLITGHDAAALDSSYNMMFNVIAAKEAIVDTITSLGTLTNLVGGE